MVHKLHIQEVNPVVVSRFRSVASQVIASTCSYVLLLDLGMAISFATIAIPDLLNAKEGLSLDENQVSWFGSISSLTQPCGAFLSGPLVDYFGRKRACLLVNIPHLIAWILMYFSWNLPSLFIANALLGIGNGIMEAPVNSYVSEISEPSIRGALCTVIQLFLSLGIFAMYLLGAVLPWREAALICVAFPIVAILLVLLAPETPVWLLSQGREKEALKSLCKLRGWTTPDNVRKEFDELVVYSKDLQLCVICQTENQKPQNCAHDKMNAFKRKMLKCKYVMFCKETMRPLVLVMLYFTFYVMSGLTPIKPNMVNICGALGMADDGKNVMVMVGVITLVTSIFVVSIIKFTGKRKLALTAMLGTALSCTALSVYAKINIPDSVFSYDTSTFPKETRRLPLVLFYLLTTFTGLSVPWVILGEVFPFRSRASAQGIGAASNYIITFLGSKTYIDLETHGKLWGTFATYAGFGFVGTIYLYFFMPETEGKTLQEIETYFNGEFKTFADDPVINAVKRLKR